MASETNKVRFGSDHNMYALLGDDGKYGEWRPLAGSVNVQFEPQGSQNTFYADNIGYYISNPAATDQITIELADLTDQAKIDLLGFIKDEVSGLLVEPTMAVRRPFAFGYQVQGDGNVLRGVRYHGTLSRPSESHGTTTESVDPDTISIEGTFVGDTFVVNGEEISVIGAACTNGGDDHAAFDNFFNVVPTPGTAPGESGSTTGEAALSALSIGSIELDPAFDPAITEYAAATANATNTVTATADGDASVFITVNGAAVASGSSASWTDGDNEVKVTVVSGSAAKTYTVTVTKS